MAHFAKIDNNNKVVQVIVVSNDDCLDENGNESEEVGVAFCNKSNSKGFSKTESSKFADMKLIPTYRSGGKFSRPLSGMVVRFISGRGVKNRKNS